MNEYQNTLDYLYNCVPMFQKDGAKAYKPNMNNTIELDNLFGNPHRNFRTIHIGGTNGKGSCSHTIAAVLQSAGYKVGLFTSPHLVDFRERIRVNGEMASKEFVVEFVREYKSVFERLSPSFFELTTAMAFKYFAEQKVDIAVVEVGMGGRIDCTNIISPEVSVITNIGLDHTQFLGDTLEKIASEKAGIIKSNVPVVIGRAEGGVRKVFEEKAVEMNTEITFAQEQTPDECEVIRANNESQVGSKFIIRNNRFAEGIAMELSGDYQAENARTIMATLRILEGKGYSISDEAYIKGFANVCTLTGFMGRWQKLSDKPSTYCDTGHNKDGITFVCQQLERIKKDKGGRLHIVFGMVNDKDINSVLAIMPKDAIYYFTKAKVNRALDEIQLTLLANKYGLQGKAYTDVATAVKEAQKNCLSEDFIFIGGSSFIVADLLANRDTLDFH